LANRGTVLRRHIAAKAYAEKVGRQFLLLGVAEQHSFGPPGRAPPLLVSDAGLAISSATPPDEAGASYCELPVLTTRPKVRCGSTRSIDSGLRSSLRASTRSVPSTTTPAGKAMFQMLGVFAEFERAIIRERVVAGMARAKANGTKSGKPDRSAGNPSRAACRHPRRLRSQRSWPARRRSSIRG